MDTGIPPQLGDSEFLQGESPDAAAGAARDNVLRILSIIWRRKWLIALGLVAGIVLGTIAYVRTPQVFESSNELVLIAKRPKLTGEAELDLNSDFGLAIHSEFMRSPEIIKTAVTQAELSRLTSFQGKKDLVPIIQSGLKVKLDTEKDRTRVGMRRMNCSFRAGNAIDAQKVLNALSVAYQAYLDETFDRLNQDTSSLLVSKIEDTKDELRNLEEQELTLRREAPQLYVSLQQDPTEKNDPASFHDIELANLEREQLKLQSRHNLLQERMEFVSSALKNSDTAAQLDEKILQWQREDRVFEKPSPEIMQLMLSEHLLQTQQYGAKHPKVIEAREKLSFIQQYLGLAPTAWIDTPQAYLEHVQTELRQLAISQQALQTRLATQFQEVDRLSEQRLRKRQIERNINRMETTYDNLIAQLNAVDLSKDQGGVIAREISPAGSGRLVEPMYLNTVGLYLFFSTVAAGALVYFLEADQRLRNIGDVRRILGNSIFGFIPRLPSRTDNVESRLAAELVTFHNPSSPGAEAFRYVRSSMFLRSRDKTHQLIQITSPEPSDGKSTISSNLAIAISQSGNKVLLIDGDLRNPQLSAIFGANHGLGLANLLGDVEEPHWRTLLTDVGVPNLYLMSSGGSLANPSEMFISVRFTDFLREARQQFDYVIIDTPPLLSFSESMTVASQVDGVIPVVLMGKTHASGISQLRDLLKELGKPIMGTVVNARDGYGTMHSSYGYYSKYGVDAYGYVQKHRVSRWNRWKKRILGNPD